MSMKMEFPDEYVNILKSYAESNHTTVETVLADTLEFLELKNEAFQHYKVVVEGPKDYLNDAEELNAAAVRQLYMDLFGEDTVGDEIHCYYDPDKSDFLYLDIFYDAEVPLWNVIEMFQNKIPGMELSGEVLSLFYVHNRFDGHHDDLVATQEWLDTDPDDRNTTAGYYESIFDDREQEEFLDDAFYDDDTDGEED